METPLTHADSIVIARSPADLYDMVCEAARTGIPQTLAALKRVAEEGT